MANEYLQRTPTSSGNKKVFTISAWTKVNDTTNGNALANTHASGSTFFTIRVATTGNTNSILVYTIKSGTDYSRYWNLADRDCSSWIHHVFAFNTTALNVDDRVIYYRNGAKVTDYGDIYGSIPLDYEFDIDTSRSFDIFKNPDAGTFGKGQLFDYLFVDGQQLTPDVFGFYKDGDGYMSSGTAQATDFRPGQWMPHSPTKIKKDINRRGGFGVNGFYLPMNDSSNPGADFHCDPNSIIKLKGEDLPQPRNGAPTTSDAFVSELRSDPFAANLVLAVPGIALENTNTELVTNGDFSNGTTGWTGLSGGSLSVEGDRLKITETTGALDAYAVNSTTITTVVGTRYTIKWTFHEGTNTTFTVRFGNSGDQSQAYLSNSASQGQFSDPGTYSFDFEATATQLNLSFIVNQANSYGYISNVSVKEALPVRDYSADIKGSGTNKTLTANGNAGVGYELGGYYGSAMTFDGADATNFNLGNDSDFDFGTGDFTIEFWRNRDSVSDTESYFTKYDNGTTQSFWFGPLDSGRESFYWYDTDGTHNIISNNNIAVAGQFDHICAERHTGTVSLYVNGVSVGISTLGALALNTTTHNVKIGANDHTSGTTYYPFDGAIQDLRVYKGVAKYKGGFDVPKPYTPVGIEAFRTTADTCKNNFATWNPLLGPQTCALADGNLTVTSSGGNRGTRSTIGVTSGKWYWEYRVGSVAINSYVGVSNRMGADGLSGGGDYVFHGTNGNNYSNPSGSFSVTNAAITTGMIIGCAFDYDAGTLDIYKDGTLAVQVTGGSFGGLSYHAHNSFNAAVSDGWEGNFGQNPSFSGTTTTGTNADGNGKGLFKYAPPTGFLALCEDNLPTPAIADPGEHFKTVLYTGSGSARNVTGVGFKPDFIWIKNRESTYQHQVFDVVRGPGKKIHPSNTDSETTDTVNISSFNTDGFSFAGGNVGVNQADKGHVAWCWKAGGAAVSNTDGSITSQVSANQTAGFSIVSYTGTGANATVGHGLGKTPNIVLCKNRIDLSNWSFNGNFGGLIYGTNKLTLQTTVGITGDTNEVMAASATTFTVGNSGATNGSSDAQIAYCWTEIEGFSKFGSYTGNGVTDGPFVYCGFKPAWVMIKKTDSSADWQIYDSSRSPVNDITITLAANVGNNEVSFASGYNIDFVSNGFKPRTGPSNAINTSGGTYIFMAFAESPFKTANAK